MKRVLFAALMTLSPSLASAQAALYTGYVTMARPGLTEYFGWPSQTVCEGFREYRKGRPENVAVSPCRAAIFYDQLVAGGMVVYLNIHTYPDGLIEALAVLDSLAGCQRVTVSVAPQGVKQSGCRRAWLVWQ